MIRHWEAANVHLLGQAWTQVVPYAYFTSGFGSCRWVLGLYLYGEGQCETHVPLLLKFRQAYSEMTSPSLSMSLILQHSVTHMALALEFGKHGPTCIAGFLCLSVLCFRLFLSDFSFSITRSVNFWRTLIFF